MIFLYNLVVVLASQLLKLVALFSPKLKLFVNGRKEVFEILSQKIKASDRTFWFHAASLGEFEQGLPVIERLKAHYPNHKIVVTFFSPSGYEVRKNNTIADATVYLPLDTKSNARKFISLVHPEMAFFIKYEYWPNYLNELKQKEVSTYLISGIFREKQVFFKWYGGFYRRALANFNYFFVQNEHSKKLLQSIGLQNVKVSGDTRFDRVAAILERDNTLGFIEEFKGDSLTIVIGSSWPKDESLIVDYINLNSHDCKFIIAPHNIKSEQIQQLKNSIQKETVLYSEKENKNLAGSNVLIIDMIGILTKIYSYADIVYVGGGFGYPGIHNILEPATFGTPVVIGPHFNHFAEATALVQLDGCLVVNNQQELNEAFENLISNEDIRLEKGHICSTFVQMNKNATSVILKHILNDRV